MRMKRCVSTQTWQHVTANLTLPFGTVSLPGSAFTSFLQLFFVARSTMMVVAPQGGLSSSFTSRLWLDNGKLLQWTEVVFWHNLAFLLMPHDYLLFCTNYNGSWFTEWRTWSAFGWFVRLVHLITNIPSLVVEQQKIVHFGYGLLFTRCRNYIKIWWHQIPDVGIALMLSWLQCVQWIGGQSRDGLRLIGEQANTQ